mmetsp:Transcript_33453/g.77083  ORF Transcript_33453/g.77083 Transcript_33453/m.77083 type:complete len:273 (+) Transcript_33453:160-978(+)
MQASVVGQLDMLRRAIVSVLPDQPLQLASNRAHLSIADSLAVEGSDWSNAQIAGQHDHLLGSKELLLSHCLLPDVAENLCLPEQMLLGQVHRLPHRSSCQDAFKRRCDEDLVLCDNCTVSYAPLSHRAIVANVDPKASTTLLSRHGQEAVQEVVVALQSCQQGGLHRDLTHWHSRLSDGLDVFALRRREHRAIKSRLTSLGCKAIVARTRRQEESHASISQAACYTGLADDISHSAAILFLGVSEGQLQSTKLGALEKSVEMDAQPEDTACS